MSRIHVSTETMTISLLKELSVLDNALPKTVVTVAIRGVIYAEVSEMVEMARLGHIGMRLDPDDSINLHCPEPSIGELRAMFEFETSINLNVTYGTAVKSPFISMV